MNRNIIGVLILFIIIIIFFITIKNKKDNSTDTYNNNLFITQTTSKSQVIDPTSCTVNLNDCRFWIARKFDKSGNSCQNIAIKLYDCNVDNDSILSYVSNEKYGFDPTLREVNPHICLSKEICNNDIDDNGNSKIDCEDSDCNYSTTYCIEYGISKCDNGRDDDSNGKIDCEDLDCKSFCKENDFKGQCSDGEDNDNDLNDDCDDYDCINSDSCKELCDDNIDNNNNGLIDCQDTRYCNGEAGCGKEICNNSIDDDGDGQIDCKDFNDCRGDICQYFKETDCGDMIDNDNNGLVDCEETWCIQNSYLCRHVTEICSNGIDDDLNGKIDCEDENCELYANCNEGLREIDCKDGIDNDGDNLIDCSDEGCRQYKHCQYSNTCVKGQTKCKFGKITSLGQFYINETACMDEINRSKDVNFSENEKSVFLKSKNLQSRYCSVVQDCSNSNCCTCQSD